MSVCAACALELSEDVALCRHHHTGHADDWATVNRLMCDFVHRGRLPERREPECEVVEESPEPAWDAA